MGLHWPPAQLTDLVSFIVGIPPDGGGRKPKRGVNSDHTSSSADLGCSRFHAGLCPRSDPEDKKWDHVDIVRLFQGLVGCCPLHLEALV